MSAPAVVIRLELEAAPRLYTDAEHEGDLIRLDEWLSAHPDLARLVCAAADLAAGEAA